MEEEGVPAGGVHLEQIELQGQVDRNRLQPARHLRKRDLPARPTDLLTGRIGHHHFDAVLSRDLIGREEDARREREARQGERNLPDLQIVEHADERWAPVIAENDLVADRHVLNVHGIRESRGECNVQL